MREEIPNPDPGSLVRVQAHPVLSRCWLGSVGRMEFLVECSGRGSQRWRATVRTEPRSKGE
ncbi:MAG: hypothetical protein RMK33_00070 [Arcobacter sp.]|nr:hypothetical protein [Bryobacteraceae bacterium]MDW8434542.1 hypothetical protein [Arcobacter sp.]